MTVRRADAKVIFATALILILLGCSAAHNDAGNYHNLVGLTVVGDDQQVTISHVRNKMDGFPLANKHCKQFGKNAIFNRMEGSRAIFNCQSAS